MNSFVYEYPTKVYFGKNAAADHLKEAAAPYQNILITYGGGSVQRNGILDEIKGLLKDKNIMEFGGIPSNPTWSKVKEGAKAARDFQADLIFAIGGGSAIDASNIIAAQAWTEEDYWNVFVHEGRIPAGKPIALGAVVIASGTGAEMNGGAVITNEEEQVKTGVFAKAPVFAFLDPDYTKTVPAIQVFSDAFDTWCHALENYFGRAEDDSISDDLSLAVMKNTIHHMKTLQKDLYDETARANLMWDSGFDRYCSRSAPWIWPG